MVKNDPLLLLVAYLYIIPEWRNYSVPYDLVPHCPRSSRFSRTVGIKFPDSLAPVARLVTHGTALFPPCPSLARQPVSCTPRHSKMATRSRHSVFWYKYIWELGRCPVPQSLHRLRGPPRRSPEVLPLTSRTSPFPLVISQLCRVGDIDYVNQLTGVLQIPASSCFSVLLSFFLFLGRGSFVISDLVILIPWLLGYSLAWF